MPKRKKKEYSYALLTPVQNEYLMSSLGRTRVMLHGEEPTAEQMLKVTEWASMSMVNKALLTGVFMGGLDIDIDDDGDVTFVPAIQLQGIVMPNGGGPH